MDRDVEAAMQRLIDKDEIIDLVHRCSYCVDHRLYDEVVDLFTEDCVVDYGPGIGYTVLSKSRLRQMFGNREVGFAATSHHNANVLVMFDHLFMRPCARPCTPGTSGRTVAHHACGAITTTL